MKRIRLSKKSITLYAALFLAFFATAVYAQFTEPAVTHKHNHEQCMHGKSDCTLMQRHCTKCAGSGTCSKCGGDGYVLGKISQEFEPCPSCNFKNKTPKNKRGKCTFCNGTGKR